MSEDVNKSQAIGRKEAGKDKKLVVILLSISVF